MVDITIVNGVYKPTYNWGAPSCRKLIIFHSPEKFSRGWFPIHSPHSPGNSRLHDVRSRTNLPFSYVENLAGLPWFSLGNDPQMLVFPVSDHQMTPLLFRLRSIDSWSINHLPSLTSHASLQPCRLLCCRCSRPEIRHFLVYFQLGRLVCDE